MFLVFLCFWSSFSLVYAIYIDGRYSIPKSLYPKYRVKDDSFFRKALKLIKIEEKPDRPWDYFKIVPLFIEFVLALVSTVLFAIDLLTEKAISQSDFAPVLALITFVKTSLIWLYGCALVAWKEIIRHKEKNAEKNQQQTNEENNRKKKKK